MSLLDTIISDTEKAEAGASSVVTFLQGLWSKAQSLQGNVMQLFDEAKERATEIAGAVTAAPPPPPNDSVAGSQGAGEDSSTGAQAAS